MTKETVDAQATIDAKLAEMQAAFDAKLTEMQEAFESQFAAKKAEFEERIQTLADEESELRFRLRINDAPVVKSFQVPADGKLFVCELRHNPTAFVIASHKYEAKELYQAWYGIIVTDYPINAREATSDADREAIEREKKFDRFSPIFRTQERLIVREREKARGVFDVAEVA